MHLSSYLGLLESGCATLAHSYRQVAEETEAQQARLTTRLKAAAPQALLVAD